MSTAAPPRGIPRSRREPLLRCRPRTFAEWRTLRRWGKLPAWELQVVGYLLRDARTRATLTQRELARRLGVTQQAVAQAERWSSNPTLGLMRRWAAACGGFLEVDLRLNEAASR